jgi:hypothetical protein
MISGGKDGLGEIAVGGAHPWPLSSRGDPFKIFLAKPLRRKANFKLLNVPNWMQMTYSEPPKTEGITPASQEGNFPKSSATCLALSKN